MKNTKLVAMIPARLGSKRIPKKNIRYLGDKPLIQYPIDLALASGIFDSVWVSTESEELGNAAIKMGAKFHKRPVELSADTETNQGFTYDFMTSHECDYMVMVNTTSPLLTVKTLNGFVEFLRENDYDTIMSVLSVKAESFYKNKPINFCTEKPKVNSQFLEPIREIVWALTAWKRDVFLRIYDSGQPSIFGGRIGLYEIPKNEAIDLDTEEDWMVAEGMIAAQENLTTNIKKRYLVL